MGFKVFSDCFKVIIMFISLFNSICLMLKQRHTLTHENHLLIDDTCEILCLPEKKKEKKKLISFVSKKNLQIEVKMCK